MHISYKYILQKIFFCLDLLLVGQKEMVNVLDVYDLLIINKIDPSNIISCVIVSCKKQRIRQSKHIGKYSGKTREHLLRNTLKNKINL